MYNSLEIFTVYNGLLCVQCSFGWLGSQVWTIIIILYWQTQREKQLGQKKRKDTPVKENEGEHVVCVGFVGSEDGQRTFE